MHAMQETLVELTNLVSQDEIRASKQVLACSGRGVAHELQHAGAAGEVRARFLTENSGERFSY